MSDTKYPKRASLEGLVGEIFKLVSRGATPEQWAQWLRVPLEHAAADGNIGLFKALIGAGADGNAGWRGCKDRTLFQAAAVGGNPEVISGLIAAGAGPDVNVLSHYHWSAASGRSALYLATSLGHEDAARRLVLAGADVNFYDPADQCGVLIKATVRGYGELVNDLLMSGADPNTRGSDGNTALHVAAESGFEGVVSTLLARGADKDALNPIGESPLIKAAMPGHLAVVNTLLAAGACIEFRDCFGYTAFDVAALHGNIGILKVFLGQGVDVNAVNVDGYTAMHRAAERGHADAIDVLVGAGADIEPKKSDGWTPLSCAATTDCNTLGCTAAVRALLRYGANAQEQANDGNTPLHLACREQCGGLDTKVDLLLRSGADETAVSNDGKTPAQKLESPPDREYRRCSPEVLERAQVLLARAPNDRAWRRRRWLVMLDSRASRKKTAGCDNRGVSGHGSSSADGGGESGGSKMAGIEHVEEDESDVVGQAGGGCAIGFGGEDGSLRAMVAALIGLELEGVFRTVVGFL